VAERSENPFFSTSKKKSEKHSSEGVGEEGSRVLMPWGDSFTDAVIG